LLLDSQPDFWAGLPRSLAEWQTKLCSGKHIDVL